MFLARCKQYGLVLFLWCLFALCCWAAPLIAVGFVWYPQHSYFRRLVKAADRMLASLLGFSGRHTLSVECADTRKWGWIHDCLNAVEDKHCENEAFEEGAYCRLSDKELGGK